MKMVGWFADEGLVSDSAPCVSAQENAGDPHYIPSKDLFRPIRPNEVLLLDLWGKHTTPGAVYADITWCGFTGETPTPEIAAAFATIVAGRDAAIAKVQDGIASGAGAAARFAIGLVIATGISIGTLFTLFVLPAVYVAIGTDHRAAADSERAKQIEDYELEHASPSLKAT